MQAQDRIVTVTYFGEKCSYHMQLYPGVDSVCGI